MTRARHSRSPPFAAFPRTQLAIGFTLFVATVAPSTGRAQTPGGSPAAEKHITIPYLASTNPGDIEFAAAECDVLPNGSQMTCRFRQVFVSVASIDSTACVITTNGYEQTFHRDPPTRWISAEEPAGDCGIVETTTLDDGGGARWTMTMSKKATRGVRAECLATAEAPTVYSWSDIRRTLPCATIQPGSIER